MDENGQQAYAAPSGTGRDHRRTVRLDVKIPLLTALLLTASNVFMTFAWYAHLKELNQRPWPRS